MYGEITKQTKQAGILNCVAPQGFLDRSCFQCIWITYLNHYQEVFADDTCIFNQDKYVHKIEDKEEVETTEQLLLHCPFYRSKRIKLFENVEIVESNFLNLNATNQVFILWFSNK